MTAVNEESTISTAEAASRLLVDPQTVREWLKSGKLRGHQEGPRGAWRVLESSLAAGVRQRRRHTGASPEVSSDLVGAVQALIERDRRSEELLAAVERERDGYRSDAATVRAAALRVNAAAGDLRLAVSRLMGVLDEQSEALVQLLSAGTPDDFLFS